MILVLNYDERMNEWYFHERYILIVCNQSGRSGRRMHSPADRWDCGRLEPSSRIESRRPDSHGQPWWTTVSCAFLCVLISLLFLCSYCFRRECECKGIDGLMAIVLCHPSHAYPPLFRVPRPRERAHHSHTIHLCATRRGVFRWRWSESTKYTGACPLFLLLPLPSFASFPSFIASSLSLLCAQTHMLFLHHAPHANLNSNLGSGLDPPLV